MPIRTDPVTTRITTTPMAGRTTALPADRVFRSALRDGASLLLGGVESAARSLPGGQIVAAAVSGTTALASVAGGGSGALSGTSLAGSSLSGTSLASTSLASTSLAGGSSNDAMELIALQQQMQDENRRYSTLSNVLKARHETAKNAIGNIR